MVEFPWLKEVLPQVAGGGAFGALLSSFLHRRRNRADADSVIVQNAAGLTEILQGEIKRLLARVENVESEVRTLNKDNMRLDREVSRLTGENEALKARCARLEVENSRLREAALPDG